MEQGGTAWELETAGAQMVAARRANDPEAEVQALVRFSEGLRNSSMGVVGAVIAPLANQLKTLAEIVTNARQADLNWRTDERDRRDAQADRLYAELDRLAVAAEESARGLGKLEQDARDQNNRHEAQIANVIAIIEARPAQRAAEQRVIDARLAAIERRLRKLDGGGDG